MIELPIAWILGIIGTLAGVIATLATVMWHTMKARLEIQDKIIDRLQTEIDRMAKGCGLDSCHWLRR